MDYILKPTTKWTYILATENIHSYTNSSGTSLLVLSISDAHNGLLRDLDLWYDDDEK